MKATSGEAQARGRARDFVFISYAREDREFLQPLLLEPLDAAGIQYWFDEHLEWDDNWWQEVRSRVHRAHAVIVLMTPRAAKSDWVTREVLVAQEKSKAIFPVLLEGKPLGQLTAQQYLDLRDGQRPNANWLAAVLHRLRSARRRRVIRAYLPAMFISLIPAIAGSVVLVQLIFPLFRDERVEIPTLSGDYNLAVAQFSESLHGDLPDYVAGEVDAFVPGVVAGAREALQQSSQDASDDIRLLRIQVEGLPVSVDGARTEDQQLAVKSIAAQSNADALLYGSITTDGAAVVVAPRLWLSPRALPRAEELSGSHTLLSTREDVSRPDSVIRLRRLVADTASDLAALTVLIRLYDSSDFDGALSAIQEVRADGFGQEGLLYVFEGNLAGKLGRFDEAKLAYERALSFPAYTGRASLGLAQVAYSAALDEGDGCSADVDVEGQGEVITTYAQLQDETDPPGANIRVKAIFGEARARVCLDASGRRADDGRGRHLLQTVIDEYRHSVGESEDDDLRELAAEAEALMGDYDARRATSLSELRPALDHLDQAAKLTLFPDRKLAFRIAQATFLARAGEYDRACEKFKQAQALVRPGAQAPSVIGLNCS
ncbi:MAG: toll/interleukin-1 receptor domain-containing protein [Actinomycetota bacterium]|nr:toll/interleukin-1 receptor domain-containing protein [Actinomycetota bacterium]